jgi:hypothetical protein
MKLKNEEKVKKFQKTHEKHKGDEIEFSWNPINQILAVTEMECSCGESIKLDWNNK